MTDWVGDLSKNKYSRKVTQNQTPDEIKEAIEKRLLDRIALLKHTTLYVTEPETEEERQELYKKQVFMREMVRTLNNRTNALISVNNSNPELNVTIEDLKNWESKDPAWQECVMIIEDIEKDMLRAKIRNIAMDGHSYILPMVARSLLPEYKEKQPIVDQRQFTQVNFNSMAPEEQLKAFKELKKFIPKKTELPVSSPL